MVIAVLAAIQFRWSVAAFQRGTHYGSVASGNAPGISNVDKESLVMRLDRWTGRVYILHYTPPTTQVSFGQPSPAPYTWEPIEEAKN